MQIQDLVLEQDQELGAMGISRKPGRQLRHVQKFDSLSQGMESPVISRVPVHVYDDKAKQSEPQVSRLKGQEHAVGWRTECPAVSLCSQLHLLHPQLAFCDPTKACCWPSWADVYHSPTLLGIFTGELQLIIEVPTLGRPSERHPCPSSASFPFPC